MLKQTKAKKIAPKAKLQTEDGLHDYLTGNSLSIEMQMQKEIEKLKEELAASEARFHNVIAKSADGIVIVNQKGTVSFVNRCAESLFNCEAEELLGKDFFGCLVVEGTSCQMDTEIIAGVGETATEDKICVVQTHVEVIRQDRQELLAEMRVVETEWEGEGAYLVSLRDITERKQTEAALRRSEARFREQATQLKETLNELQRTHEQLVQSEKMSSLGLLIAGIAHEINNPVNFINGNLEHINQYTRELLGLLKLYQHHYPYPIREIQTEKESVDLDFIIDDLPKILSSMKLGVERICQIVVSLRKFTRIDEAEMKPLDIHEGIDSTLLILQNRLTCQVGAKERGKVNPQIRIVKEYSQIPEVECYGGSINQVLMNIISNAIDALEDYNLQRSPEEIATDPSIIKIRTQMCDRDYVTIKITDNGPGIIEDIKKRIFDPFFTTKPVGKGTGLGLSISYQIIVDKHGGELKCNSQVGQGTEFSIKIPIRQPRKNQGDSAEG
ncbi:MAG TPA: ATP-binding protein [Leptolyngbyaceae cyanobacterium]